jgi:hypothetical protein
MISPILRLVASRGQLAVPRRIRCVYRLGIESLAAGKPWTRKAAESGGVFFTLGVHALDLSRWLARGRGEPLEDLRASAAHRDGSADFPLVAELSGRPPGGVQVVAGADFRDEAPFRLELEVDGSPVETSSGEKEDAEAECGVRRTVGWSHRFCPALILYHGMANQAERGRRARESHRLRLHPTARKALSSCP